MTAPMIDLQILANAGFPLAKFAPGEVIFAEGEEGDKMFVVRTGEVEIVRGARWSRRWGPVGFSARWP